MRNVNIFASFDGKKGRWYPEWEFRVFVSARLNQSQNTDIWDPNIRGPENIKIINIIK